MSVVLSVSDDMQDKVRSAIHPKHVCAIVHFLCGTASTTVLAVFYLRNATRRYSEPNRRARLSWCTNNQRRPSPCSFMSAPRHVTRATQVTSAIYAVKEYGSDAPPHFGAGLLDAARGLMAGSPTSSRRFTSTPSSSSSLSSPSSSSSPSFSSGGAQVVLLGCTELNSIMPRGTSVPTVDAGEVLAEALVATWAAEAARQTDALE